jgi:hypothetical protein
MKYYASKQHFKTCKLGDWQDPPDKSYKEIDFPLYERLSALVQEKVEVAKLGGKSPGEQVDGMIASLARVAEIEKKYEKDCLKQSASKHGYKNIEDGTYGTWSVIGVAKKGKTKEEEIKALEKIEAFMATPVAIPAKQLILVLAYLYAKGEEAPAESRGVLFRAVQEEGRKSSIEIGEVDNAIAVSSG